MNSWKTEMHSSNLIRHNLRNREPRLGCFSLVSVAKRLQVFLCISGLLNLGLDVNKFAQLNLGLLRTSARCVRPASTESHNSRIRECGWIIDCWCDWSRKIVVGSFRFRLINFSAIHCEYTICQKLIFSMNFWIISLFISLNDFSFIYVLKILKEIYKSGLKHYYCLCWWCVTINYRF